MWNEYRFKYLTGIAIFFKTIPSPIHHTGKLVVMQSKLVFLGRKGQLSERSCGVRLETWQDQQVIASPLTRIFVILS